MVELIWDGKYDAHGKRTAPYASNCLFKRSKPSMKAPNSGKWPLTCSAPAAWRNRLIWGDKKYVLPALLDEFAGKVDLIYIDPPFHVGSDFSYQVAIQDEEFTKLPSMIEQKAYRDTWGRGLESYLQWFYETVILLRDLLNDTGSIFVHLDWHAGHYVKLILDEIFGVDNFRNQIAWYYYNRFAADGQNFGRKYDMVFWYSKGSQVCYHPVDELREEPQKRLLRKKVAGVAVNVKDEEGNLVYYEQATRRIDDVWRIPLVPPASSEYLNYPTQKPETLLERILTACSNENDLVLDCFCGSGTTAAVAEKLNRRWITCDLGRFAIHTTRKRLLSIPNVKPFVVQNLGKYERQAWQVAEFGSAQQAALITRQYRHFILDLYHARPIDGYTWLHGVKEGRMVHVGPVDSPISPSDITSIATEFRKSIGTGQDAPKIAAVDVLGWDFAFELNEIARQQAAQANITLRFLRIPREVLEQKAVDQGDIHFFELAALAVDLAHKGRDVTLKLTDFVIPPDDVPEDVQRAISHWSQWLDYWAVDWDNKGDTFHNTWQAYRTRQDNILQLQTTHRYDQPGEYTILVKAIDILGNDTTKTVRVQVV